MYSPVAMRYPIQIAINLIIFYSMTKQRNTKASSYKSLAPLAVSGRLGGKEETMKVHESERVVSVSIPYAAYAASGYLVNPGLANSFPWLAGHAALYDRYRFKKLRFRWVPIVSATTSGNIVLAFDHDPYDGLPQSSASMCSLSYYSTGSIWEEIILDIPCDNTWRFVRSGPVGGDVKTYDLGALYLSSEGVSVTGVAGYIQADYEIEFINKNITSGVGSGSSFNTALFSGDGTINTIAPGANYVFNVPALGYLSGGLYNVVSVNGAYNIFTLPKGRWIVRARLQNNSALSTTAAAGGTSMAYLVNPASTQIPATASGYLEAYAQSTGADTFWIYNSTAAGITSTGQYCSISFTLLD